MRRRFKYVQNASVIGRHRVCDFMRTHTHTRARTFSSLTPKIVTLGNRVIRVINRRRRLVRYYYYYYVRHFNAEITRADAAEDRTAAAAAAAEASTYYFEKKKEKKKKRVAKKSVGSVCITIIC